MNKEFFLNKIPWLWIAIVILMVFIFLQDYHILILKKGIYRLYGVIGILDEKKHKAEEVAVYVEILTEESLRGLIQNIKGGLTELEEFPFYPDLITLDTRLGATQSIEGVYHASFDQIGVGQFRKNGSVPIVLHEKLTADDGDVIRAQVVTEVTEGTPPTIRIHGKVLHHQVILGHEYTKNTFPGLLSLLERELKKRYGPNIQFQPFESFMFMRLWYPSRSVLVEHFLVSLEKQQGEEPLCSTVVYGAVIIDTKKKSIEKIYLTDPEQSCDS